MKKRDDYMIYGIIGCPVEHSLSPFMQNAAFRKLDIEAAYLPFRVNKGKLKSFISSLRKSRISGFNVTIPYKSDVIKLLDKIDPIAAKIGAVNTVVVKNKKFIGYNTDSPGFIRSLKEDLKINLKNKSVFVIGAGGAARAVAFGLIGEGIRSIYLFDVIKKKADALAKDVRGYSSYCDVVSSSRAQIKESLKNCGLLVNCTPLGMRKSDPLPIDPRLLRKGLKVYDIVYTPLVTKLIRVARKKGIKAVGGAGMLLYQGASAFELWTKKKAPIELMRKELYNRLK
ncbi:shikimate dehydrogenase [Candidatus Omnitrophota bacterium]